MTGTLYGLGVGPGDPELMTLKAHRPISPARALAPPAPAAGASGKVGMGSALSN